MSQTARGVRDSFEVDPGAVDLGKIKVQFKEGNPCLPRYPDLYRYPGLQGQVEPAFQLASAVTQVSVVLALDSDQVELMPDPKDDKLPLCREWGQKNPDAALKVEYPNGDKSRCSLVWKPQASTLKAFKIYCRKKDGEPTQEEQVHGGVIVVFSTYSSGKMGKGITPPAHQHGDHHRIHLLGSDSKGRPIYDIHQEVQATYHEHVEIEPAYRLRWQQEILSFAKVMKIAQAQWQDKVIFPQTGQKPPELTHGLTGEGKEFQFKWTVENPINAPAKVTTFHLVPKLADGTVGQPLPPALAHWGTWERYAEALERIGIDPIIVQPPSCDPMVCP
jgi:hypothetical protein